MYTVINLFFKGIYSICEAVVRNALNLVMSIIFKEIYENFD